jgi:hypothetical protein
MLSNLINLIAKNKPPNTFQNVTFFKIKSKTKNSNIPLSPNPLTNNTLKK